MIPSELVIDGVPWQISISDDMDGDVAGETRKRKGTIILAKDLIPAMREMTFWHEIIHALCTTRDIRLVPGNQDDMEEQMAGALGPALYSFFLHNAADIEWRYDSPE